MLDISSIVALSSEAMDAKASLEFNKSLANSEVLLNKLLIFSLFILSSFSFCSIDFNNLDANHVKAKSPNETRNIEVILSINSLKKTH
ncbi:hypothetical protein [Clostridium carboxidivorans]|uniref:hypothetical protein n=1 Tax=Clostridium carboxidivorans TaxID=217159 RepID=UPI00067FF3C0|nr:hypothetical protein [Clostridium carboxidivorans]